VFDLGYDKDFGGVSKVVFGGSIDRIDHIQMAFDRYVSAYVTPNDAVK
jgi:hypothetical protein